MFHVLAVREDATGEDGNIVRKTFFLRNHVFVVGL